ncbi:MAG: cupredoxin domain-containing protein, partial [Acidimicrobiia bacterium]|nr:cupredoxin domain-containing protein [Acidimicrobiia bacterium]
MRRLFLPAMAVVLLAVTACANGETTQPETTTTTQPETTATTEAGTTTSPDTTESTPSAPEASLSIRMAAFAFSGDETGSVGDTVRVVNNDDFSHTWTSTDQEFHSGTLRPGEEFFYTFEQPGTYSYFCQIHPEMS